MRLKMTCSLFAATISMFSAVTALAADAIAVADAVDRRVKPMMEKHGIPGMAVAVTVDGEQHFFNYGLASFESRARVTQDTLFEIGSLTKIFTAMLGTHAAAIGKLSLDDHPAKYLPALAGRPLNRATLLHLATYTAGGLPLQFPDTVGSLAEAQSYFAQFDPVAAPGEQRRYSNPSIGLFGHVTSVALGGDFTDLVHEILFEPLGLQNSYFDVPQAAMDRYAWGYDREGKPVRVNPGVFDAQAYGVKTSSADLIRLVEANIRPDGFDETMHDAISASQVGYFSVGAMVQGMGWEGYPEPFSLDGLLAGNAQTMAMQANPVAELAPPRGPSAPTLFNKTGSTNGFGAYVAFVPDANIGIALLANKNYPIPDRVAAAHAILAELGK